MQKAKIPIVLLFLGCLLVVAQIAFSEIRAVRTPSSGTTSSDHKGSTLSVPATEATPSVPAADHRGLKPPFMEDGTPGPIMTPQGMPGIQPSIIGAQPNTPSFTVDDVMRYHNANNALGVGGYASTVAPTILKIEFLTERELRGRSPMATSGLPDDTLLCYVQYSGNFLLPGRPGVTESKYYTRAAEVFNARTGNRMVVGVGPWVK